MLLNDKPETAAPTRTRPFTSEEYMESLRDGREIWIYGERVKDVTTHPAFRNTVRMLARLYDALHGEKKDILCAPTDTGNGGYTHKFFKVARSRDEVIAQRGNHRVAAAAIDLDQAVDVLAPASFAEVLAHEMLGQGRGAEVGGLLAEDDLLHHRRRRDGPAQTDTGGEDLGEGADVDDEVAALELVERRQRLRAADGGLGKLGSGRVVA